MRCLIKDANIFKADGVLKKGNVLVEGNKIIKVSENRIEVPAQEYNFSGYTLMPGFINSHVHLMDCFDGFNEQKLKKFLLSGITYLRDQGILSRHTSKDAVIWREKLKKSSLYPSIAVCGKFISSINGQGGVEPLGVSSEAGARDIVKMLVADGVDHIKTTLDSGYDAYTRSLDLLTLNVLSAICDEAHRHGKKVSVHVSTSDKLQILLEAGIDEAGHTCFDKISDETLEFMVKNEIYMTPTLSLYGEITTNWGAPFLYVAMDNIKRFVDMGGVIGFGNDHIEEKKIWSQ